MMLSKSPTFPLFAIHPPQSGTAKRRLWLQFINHNLLNLGGALMEGDLLFAIRRPSADALAILKRIKNSIIGSRGAKTGVVGEGSVPLVVEWLNGEDEDQDVLQKTRIEAANVIASLAHGSDVAVKELLQCRALQAILHAIAHLQPTDSAPLKASLSRALKSLIVACASALGFGVWGLGKAHSQEILADFANALDELYKPASLDIFLPLLQGSLVCATEAALTLAHCPNEIYCTSSVLQWLPVNDRTELEEARTKRGWEKPGVPSTEMTKIGGWAVGKLLDLVSAPDHKAQEAALLGLAALVHDNTQLSNILMRPAPYPDSSIPFQQIFTFTSSRVPGIKIAACLCVTRMIRASDTFTIASVNPSRTLTYLLNEIIRSKDESDDSRMKACFIFSYLVADSKSNQDDANLGGSMAYLLNVLEALEPPKGNTYWEDTEPESKWKLREGALTALASLTLLLNPLRRALVEMQPPFMSILLGSLKLSHPGARYAACQCARSLSRSIEVLRTSSVDSGLGFQLFEMMKTEQDKRIKCIIVKCIANLTLDFSPIRKVLIDAGIHSYLVGLCDEDEDEDLRISSLWALKSMLYRAAFEDKQKIIGELGWIRFRSLLRSPSAKAREQGITFIQNVATDEKDAEFLKHGIGEDFLFESLRLALEAEEEDVAVHAAQAILNLSNILPSLVLSRALLLDALREAQRLPHLRKTIAEIVHRLAEVGPLATLQLKDAGMS